MVPLPLFKFAALFVRHISKYGANYIKAQAHEHPQFRTYAARYGQAIHQVNMRMQVTLLRDRVAERKAKEKAEAPTVKTEEQTRAEEKLAPKDKAAQQQTEAQKSVWSRKFRPLPEAKAVDLFADVIGDAFILLVASALIIYEYQRSSGKPDTNAENIQRLDLKLKELEDRENALEEKEKKHESRVETMEQAIEEMRKATEAAKAKSGISSILPWATA